MANWLLEKWVRWWWLDVLAVAALTTLSGVVADPGTGIDLLGQLSLADRRNVYTDLLQLAIIFAGFGGVVFAIFVGFQSRSVREIRSKVGAHLLRVWMAALLTPWVSSFLIVLAKIVDRGDIASTNGARWVAAGATLLVALQFLRMLWVFYQLAAIDIDGHRPTIPTSQKPAVIRVPQGRKEKP